jgi:hypothetical protein
MAIEDRSINVFQRRPSQRDNLKDDTLGNLSLAYPTLEPEIEDWLRSAPHLQRSLRYGLFDPETTTFVFDLEKNPLQYDWEHISDFYEEECLQKNVRRVRIKFDYLGEFHEFLKCEKDPLQKLENIEFCDIEWSNSSQGWEVEARHNKNIVGWFWFGARDLMRTCPRKVPCSCCIADPEIRLRERDGAWQVLKQPEPDHSGWKVWGKDDSEEHHRIFFELTRLQGMLQAFIV